MKHSFAVCVLLVIGLLTSPTAESAEVTIPTELCLSVNQHYASGACPAQILNPQAGGNVTDTTASGSTQCAGNCVGTMFAYARAASAGTPDWDTCVAGTGALNQQSDAIVSPGTSNFSFINLTPDETIRITYCFREDGSNYDDRPSHDLAFVDFQTLPGTPGGGGSIENTGFFVDPDNGNNNNNGTSSSTPWETLSKVNSTVTAIGSKVYLKRGGVWTGEKLTIDWDGQSDGSEDATVSCYYFDPLNGNEPYKCDTGSDPIAVGDSDMPEIRGTLTDACIAALNCDYNNNLGGPASFTDGQIAVIADYVTVELLHISYSKARPIKVKGRDQADNEATNVTFQNNYISNAGNHIVFERGHVGAVIKGNLVRYWGLCENQDRNGNDPIPSLLPNADNCGQFGVPGGISVNRGDYALVDGNTMEFGWGECFNLLVTDFTIVRNNSCGNPASGGYYCDACRFSVIENNIAVGSQTQQCGPASGDCNQWRGGGLNMNVEDSAADRDLGPTLIRNNIGVGVSGQPINVTLGLDAQASNREIASEVYGNTFVRQESYGLRFISNAIANAVTNYEFGSNLLWDEDVGDAEICWRVNSNPAFTLNWNGWYGANPSNIECQGANDTESRNAPPGFTSYNDFKLMDADSMPTPADVTPSGSIPGNPAYDTENHNLDFDTYFTQRQWDNMTPIGVCNSSKANWNRKLICDHTGAARSTTAPTAGAIE